VKDVKQIAAWLNTKTELERKWSFEAAAKRANWATAAAVSGTAAVGALTATKERTGKMAAIGGASGLLAWLVYDYFRQPPTPTGKSPVKYSTGNWVADRRVAEATLRRNFDSKILATRSALAALSPEMRERVFSVVRLDAIRDAMVPITEQRKSLMTVAATSPHRTHLLAFVREQFAQSAPSSSGPGDSVIREVSPTTPTGPSTGSSGPGDALYRGEGYVDLGKEPEIETGTPKSIAEQINWRIRQSPAVAESDKPPAVQTDQGVINAIAQEIRKKHPKCPDEFAPGCLTDEEVYRMAERTAANNAKRAASGEPANWLTNLVLHGHMVKNLSMQWLAWKAFVTPMDTVDRDPSKDWTAQNLNSKYAWFKLRAEPPPPVGDVSRLLGGGWVEADNRLPGMRVPQLSIPTPAAVEWKDVNKSMRAAYQPVADKLNCDPFFIGKMDRFLNEWFTPWCCQPGYLREGMYPRDMVTHWMIHPRYPFRYMPDRSGQTLCHYGRRWTPRTDADYWGFDKYPVTLSRGNPIKIPSWYRDEFRRTGEDRWSNSFALDQIREYYKTSYWMVWAGIVYCMHAGKPIPSWYRKHALFHGVPCPSKRMEERGRNFARCTGADLQEAEQTAKEIYRREGIRIPVEAFCPTAQGREFVPIPTGIGGKHFGTDITRSEVEQMLSLVVKHTPVPGSIPSGDELRRYQRRLCDWPKSTGAYRPGFELPANWLDMVEAGRQKKDAYKYKRKTQKIAQSIIMTGAQVGISVAGAAAAKAATTAVAAAGTIVQGMVSAGINGAMTLAMDVGNDVMLGRSPQINKHLFKYAMAVAASAAAPLAEKAGEAATTKLQSIVTELEIPFDKAGEAWQHTWALIGDVSDQFSTAMSDVATDVQGFIKKEVGRGVGGVLNGIADDSVVATIAKYSDQPTEFFTESAAELRDKAITFIDKEAKDVVPDLAKKRVAKWQEQAADLEASAKIMMDF
jgi:hypothetical protein